MATSWFPMCHRFYFLLSLSLSLFIYLPLFSLLSLREPSLVVQLWHESVDRSSVRSISNLRSQRGNIKDIYETRNTVAGAGFLLFIILLFIYFLHDFRSLQIFIILSLYNMNNLHSLFREVKAVNESSKITAVPIIQVSRIIVPQKTDALLK